MVEGLFRQQALRKIASPEQLDQLPRVIGPLGWLSLLVCAILSAGAVVWSFAARLPVKVAGVGILVQSGGIYEVMPLAAGRLIQVGAAVGDQVNQEQVIAHMELPRMEEQVRQARLTLDNLKAKRETTDRFGRESMRLQAESRTLKVKELKNSRAGLGERLKWLSERIKNQEELLASGLIIKQTLLSSRQEFQSVQDQIRSIDSQLYQVSVEGSEQEMRQKGDLLALDQQIAESRQQLKSLESELRRLSSVRSPWAGRVIELTAMAGDYVGEGSPIMRIENTSENLNDLKAVLFVAPQEGKKIREGMKVLVNPSTVHATEYGGINGLVTSVSDQPSSFRSMQRLLVNEQLTQMLTGGGSPFQITVSLIPDVETFSGFNWTSGKGPRVKIQSGTLCEGQVVVDETPPVSYVIPFFKKMLLGERDPFSEPVSERKAR